MQNKIFKRIYKTKGRITSQGKAINEKYPVGMILARKNDENLVEFGYSSVHPKDKYSDEMAFLNVAANLNACPVNLPTRIRNEFPKFVERAKRYFKDARFGI